MKVRGTNLLKVFVNQAAESYHRNDLLMMSESELEAEMRKFYENVRDANELSDLCESENHIIVPEEIIAFLGVSRFKFKIGDTVKVDFYTNPYFGRKGTIEAAAVDGWCEPIYDLKFDDGLTYRFFEGTLSSLSTE